VDHGQKPVVDRESIQRLEVLLDNAISAEIKEQERDSRFVLRLIATLFKAIFALAVLVWLGYWVYLIITETRIVGPGQE
jgi:uncharacterized membrane protein YukC